MKEQNLIFLISQPRSGSTLTQIILGAHSNIYTRSEPWIMFNSAYSLKKVGMKSEYNFKTAHIAINDFISNIPDGDYTFYLETLKEMHLKLYGKYLEKLKKEFFLDKTPRYYLIINELKRIFPNAKFIILIRNPLAILSSIIRTWTSTCSATSILIECKYDLFTAIDLLLKQIYLKEKNFIIIKYEDIIRNPKNSFLKLTNHLNIKFEEHILETYKATQNKMLYGDPDNVYNLDGIKNENDMKWINELKDTTEWNLLHEYLHLLGKERIEKMGYSFENLNNLLEEKKYTLLSNSKENIKLKNIFAGIDKNSDFTRFFNL
jgi:hypothetical protein